MTFLMFSVPIPADFNFPTFNYARYVEMNIDRIEEELLLLSPQLKLKFFTDYVKTLSMTSLNFTFTDGNPIAEHNTIRFYSNKPEAIAALKVFWIFSKLRLWDDHELGSLTNEKIVLDIILKRQGLLPG